MLTQFIFVDGCGYIELELPVLCIQCCYHSGECDADCEHWIETEFIRNQFDAISDETLIKSLCEVWDDADAIKNADRKTNEIRALWIACGNAVDNCLT